METRLHNLMRIKMPPQKLKNCEDFWKKMKIRYFTFIFLWLYVHRHIIGFGTLKALKIRDKNPVIYLKTKLMMAA